MSFSRRGSLAQGLGVMVLISFIAVAISQMSVFFSKTVKRKMQASRASSQNVSGAETMLVAYRLAEATYSLRINNCDTPQPFFEALRMGSGCDSTVTGGNITVFTNTGTQDVGATEGLYSYTGAGCVISQNASTCANGLREFMVARFAGDIRSLATAEGYRFSLNGFNPQRQLVEFTAAMENFTNRQPQGRVSFAIRASLANAAHLEQSGNVTQENPDPIATCPGSEWADFFVFNPGTHTCLKFSQLGSGTGLAYFRERYFGFRPFDGQVIDLLASSTVNTYLVLEDGTLGGVDVFPHYNKDALINVDDITVIGSQVYYVANSGPDAHIGVWSPNIAAPASPRVRLCELGAKGWAQSYEGIGAYMPSDMLLPVATESGAPRIATFFLKTSSGDLLHAVITGVGSGFPGTPTVSGPANMTYACTVFKEPALQQIEFTRTNGFDRTEGGKPYILY